MSLKSMPPGIFKTNGFGTFSILWYYVILGGNRKLVHNLHETKAACRVIDTRYGPLSILSDGDDLIGRFLKECGEWAFFETSFIASVLEDGARVLDGGAFLGTFGLGIGLRRKLGLLCAAEANPQIIPLLDANLRRNANVQFEVIASLLSGSEAPPRIGHVNSGNLGSASYSEDALGDEILPQPEAVVTLKTLRERYGSFDLIKLDIEGMEREVLHGDEEYLSRGSTTLWIECNENQRSLEVLDLLLSWGVQVNYFAFPSHNPDNFLRLHKPILPWAYEAGLLVSPGRPPVLSGELSAHGCILRPVASRDALEDAMWLTPRGLPEELAVADAPTLAAVASRALRGQERSRFLVAELAENVWSRLAATQEGLACAEHLAVSRLAEIEEERRIRTAAENLAVSRLAEIEEERRVRTGAENLAVSRLAEIEEERRIRTAAEDLAVSRLTEIQEERFMRKNAEERLAEATSLALERLASLGEVRDRATFAESASRDVAFQLALTNEELATIKSTLSWRLSARVNRFVARRPRLHHALRSARAAAAVLLGRR